MSLISTFPVITNSHHNIITYITTTILTNTLSLHTSIILSPPLLFLFL